MKQTIAIIGATGKMGRAMAKQLAVSRYRLLLFSNHPEEAKILVEEIRQQNPDSDVECSCCPHDASWEADIIILAVPYHSEKEVAGLVADVATQKIVISISNPFNETYDALITRPGTSAAEELQQFLPHAKVVKAFNTNSSNSFYKNENNGTSSDAFIAGDDEESVNTVKELVETAGYRPLVAGKLAASQTLEQMTLLLLQLDKRYGCGNRAAWKILNN